MNFDDIFSTPEIKPPMITIVGGPGTGKTTVANTFPRTVFIRFEDGLSCFTPENMPMATGIIDNVDHLFNNIFPALFNGIDKFDTIAIDSITQAELLFIQHVIKSDPKKPKSINQACGGYGAGLAAVASLHQRLRNACERFRDKGKTVIFIGHVSVETIDPPDSDPYTKWSLDMGKGKSHYLNNVDLVPFLALDQYVVKKNDDDKKGKTVASGNIIANCKTSASNCSKARFDMPAKVQVNKGENPFIQYIPFFNQAKGE